MEPTRPEWTVLIWKRPQLPPPGLTADGSRPDSQVGDGERLVVLLGEVRLDGGLGDVLGRACGDGDQHGDAGDCTDQDSLHGVLRLLVGGAAANGSRARPEPQGFRVTGPAAVPHTLVAPRRTGCDQRHGAVVADARRYDGHVTDRNPSLVIIVT